MGAEPIGTRGHLTAGKLLAVGARGDMVSPQVYSCHSKPFSSKIFTSKIVRSLKKQYVAMEGNL